LSSFLKGICVPHPARALNRPAPLYRQRKLIFTSNKKDYDGNCFQTDSPAQAATPNRRPPLRATTRPSSPRLQLSLASLFLLILPAAGAKQPPAPHSQWVYPGPGGALIYRHFKTGDRIVDFSYAGYMGGGVTIPSLPVKKTVNPSGGDDTAAIQKALDEVSALPLTSGIRGAVLLAPGHFHCSQTLTIAASGVVLRGSGTNDAGTEIEMTGEPHLAFSITGKSNIVPVGASTPVADTYIPAGAMSFTVRDASTLKAGDTIQIVRPVTPAWLRFMGMDALSRNGKKETWVSGELKAERRIVAVKGNQIQLDVPLTDSYDAKYLGEGGTTVVKVEHAGQIEQAGIEDLRLVAPAQKITLSQKQFTGLRMKDAVDSWVRNIRMADTTEAVGIGEDTRRITVDNVNVTQSIPIQGAAKPADFAAGGSQILFNRVSGSGDNVFYFATGPRQQGPNVVLNCTFHGDGHIQPHQRWATGLLIDGCQVPEGGIDLMNRGEMGSGHGWAIGWGVVWNSTAKSFLIQMPPGAANWSIGNRGEQILGAMPTYPHVANPPMLPQGIIESQGKPVAPSSLYLKQLSDRLGPQAVKNIGY